MEISKYTLLNLDCAHCAHNIENALADIPGINYVKVDFAEKTLMVGADEISSSELKGKAQKCIDAVEPGIKITAVKDARNKMQFRREIFNIVMSTVIFLLSLLIGNMYYKLGIILSVLSIILCGYNIFLKAFKSLLHLKMDEKVLMTIAVVAAIFIGENTEAFAVILLFRIGSLLESKALSRAGSAIKDLAGIIPDTAHLLKDGLIKDIPIDKLNVGDIVCIYPYEKIPADGIIIEGESSLDVSAITGESIPIDAMSSTSVLSGMKNGAGKITIKILKRANDSTAAKIIDLIENAAGQKAESENIITRFSKVYTPIVIVLSLLVFLIPTLIFNLDFETWLSRALVFLVASCPCSIVISVPLAFYSGIGLSSKMGILFKGSRFIEIMASANTIAFDKTATLTTGELSIKNVYQLSNVPRDEILYLAKEVEKYSNHPVARAIKACSTKSYGYTANDHKELLGFGASASIDGKEVVCGKRELFAGKNLKDYEGLTIYLSFNNDIIGAIELFDTIDKNVIDTIDSLKNIGIDNLYILSGDSKKATEKVAKECKIEKYYAKLLPEDKLKVFNEIKNTNGKAIFIGDGINDTPTLAASDCGIAMGKGSSAAIDVGDVVIMNNSIDKIPKAILLSRKVLKIVKENISFAILIKAIVLIGATMGITPMWLAVVSDTGVTLLTILNSSAKRLRIK